MEISILNNVVVLVMPLDEAEDLKQGLYHAMKVLDQSTEDGSRDKQLADRLEAMHDQLS